MLVHRVRFVSNHVCVSHGNPVRANIVLAQSAPAAASRKHLYYSTSSMIETTEKPVLHFWNYASGASLSACFSFEKKVIIVTG